MYIVNPMLCTENGIVGHLVLMLVALASFLTLKRELVCEV